MDNGSLFDQRGHSEVPTSGALVPFEFPFTGQQVRAAMIDDEPWFVAPDACAILKHSNVTMAVKGLDDDEKRTIDRASSEALSFPDLFSDPRIQSVTLINESGLYTLVLRSHLPAAKAFRRWVTHDLLPSLRKNGRFDIKKVSNRDLALMILAESDRADQAEARAVVAETRNAELEPAAAQAETYAAADGLTPKRAFARDVQQWATERGIKVLQSQVFDFLGHIGLIIRVAGSEHDQATAEAIKDGKAKNSTKKVEMPDGTVIKVKYGKLTSKGEQYAWKRIYAAIGEHGTLDLDVIKGTLVPADPKVIRP
ncbi:BRO family protein [Nonomuraea rubra]|uniref:Anti-repressor protein n=1 Tax=Nonomuraea rubra TaxID=46180 RepID=A0A7X0P6W6_9ACTN|nr:BRO family protein [Nonomuraea rubra]MBB6556176.1 anti-repressor protein [Nonomuraea rubra]